MAVVMPGAALVSRLPGRVRLRHACLRPAARNHALRDELAEWEGVVLVEGNPATGSLLIHYDVARVAASVMEARLGARMAALTAPPPAAAPAPAPARPVAASAPTLRRLNRAAKVGMLVSLSGTLAALSMGKKLHAAFGVLHLAFLLVHLANHRKRVLH